MIDISVIIPLYKGGKYIKAIVDMMEKSFDYAEHNQRKLKMELIFINDYPEEKFDEIRSQKLRISYIYNNKNMGIHASRIIGIHAALGIYIHMLDQDDIIKENFYISQLQCIENREAVVCNGVYRTNKFIFEPEMSEIDENLFISKGCQIISPGQVLVRKNSIPQAWIKNIIQNSGCDDWLLWILMVYQGSKFSYNSEMAYIHVEDGNNQSFHWDRMSISLAEIKNIVQNQKIEDELKIQTLNCINKFICDYDKFYKFDVLWNKISKEQFIEYFETQNIKTIGIYGYGNIGKKIIKTFQKCELSIWTIDRDVRYIEQDIKIYRLTEKLPNADLIIVTPLRGGEELKSKLRNVSQTEVMLIDEFISMVLIDEFM